MPQSNRIKMRRRKARHKQFVWSYLSTHPCIDCNEKDPIVLEFDHVRGAKRANISQLLSYGSSIGVLKHEISKCEVRCANCHRRRTATEQRWSKGILT